MQQQQFISLFKGQAALDKTQLADLELLTKAYPYFGSAHLLYTKALKEFNELSYPKQLRKTAIVANSRTVLYNLLHTRPAGIKEEVVVTNPAIADFKEEPKAQAEPVVEEIKTQAVAIPAEPEEEPVVKPLNPVTITNSDIKVIYINTIASQPVIEKTPEPEKPVVENKELDLVKTIENETDAIAEEAPAESKDDRFRKELELEISKGIVQSYLETDVIKTPELEKTEEKEPVSFTDWLQKIKKEAGSIQKDTGPTLKTEKPEPEKETKRIEKEPKISENSKKPNVSEQKRQLIDKIIETDPGRIKLGNTKFFTPNTDAKQSLLENEHLVTETLAKIYALQGNISKAIRAYEILSLKFPQKSVYFASLIEKLKKGN